MSTVSTNVPTHLFWVLSRGAGTTALILSSASVGFGLVISGKLVRGSGPDRRSYHEILSLAVMAALVVHVGALLADSFLHPTVLDVTVPFVFSYKTFATSLGIVAAWGMIFLGLSYYLRDWIGNERWKLIHRFTLLVWIAGLVHTFLEGTDRGQVWFIALIALTTAPALVLLAYRVAGRRLGSAASAVTR
jgi:hypothetical protein